KRVGQKTFAAGSFSLSSSTASGLLLSLACGKRSKKPSLKKSSLVRDEAGDGNEADAFHRAEGSRTAKSHCRPPYYFCHTGAVCAGWLRTKQFCAAAAAEG